MNSHASRELTTALLLVCIASCNAAPVMPSSAPLWPKAQTGPITCVHLSAPAAEGWVNCGNGAACPADTRCTVSSGMSGLRGMCEPAGCDAHATTGGPLNQTCWGERSNAKLICKVPPHDPHGPSTFISLIAKKDDFLCDLLRNGLPGDCTIRDDCFEFTCGLELYDIGLRYGAFLNMCRAPLGVGVTVDTIPSTGPFPFQIVASSQVQKFPIPGVSFKTPVGSAGAYATGLLQGSLSRVKVTLGIDACAEIWPLPLTCYGGVDLITFESQLSDICDAKKVREQTLKEAASPLVITGN